MIESRIADGTVTVDVAMLVDALDTERALLADLAGILCRQREGMATDDIDVVDASVFSANRVIHTLGEARRRRRAILGILGGSAASSLEELEAVLGAEMTPDVITARERLWTQAADVARDIEVNRRVLRHVMGDWKRVVRATHSQGRADRHPGGGHGRFDPGPSPNRACTIRRILVEIGIDADSIDGARSYADLQPRPGNCPPTPASGRVSVLPPLRPFGPTCGSG